MHLQRILILAGFTALSMYSTPAPAQSSTAWGEALAQQHCARCHGIGKIGESPIKSAPPFRDLSKRYPIEALEEALAEGIVVGHPAMPQFTFEPPEINALLKFISALGAREPAPRGR